MFSSVQETGSGCLFLPGYFARNSFALSRFFSISLKNARSPLRILRSLLLRGCSIATNLMRVCFLSNLIATTPFSSYILIMI